ncbi:PAS domain S-box protein [bacterium]|nr:PAS domain S-box protein [bacterium]RQV95060.1 MAG: hybrid sensor histidine kinase/response regulator [bacterium]
MQKDKRIIYIDHTQKYRKKVKGAFSQKGYDCIPCSCGYEGLQQIAQTNPDVVVVECSLSDISGEEVYSRFLTDNRFHSIRDIPFIAITNNGDGNKPELFSLGFSACLRKPFRAKELIEFVENVLVSNKLKKQEVNFWKTVLEARDFLESVVESSTDSIIVTDNVGIATYCNRASEEMLGYRFEEVVGQRVSHFLEKGSSELLRIAAFMRRRNKVQNYKTVVIRKDGHKIPINLSISSMKNGNGKAMGALVVSKIIGGKEFTEYDTNESDRLAAIVETAVAVNHEINNPLVPILGNVQFLLQDESIASEDIKRRLRIIMSNARRIRNITQKLARITHPVTKEYLRGTRMLDIEAST